MNSVGLFVYFRGRTMAKWICNPDNETNSSCGNKNMETISPSIKLTKGRQELWVWNPITDKSQKSFAFPRQPPLHVPVLPPRSLTLHVFLSFSSSSIFLLWVPNQIYTVVFTSMSRTLTVRRLVLVYETNELFPAWFEIVITRVYIKENAIYSYNEPFTS